MTNDSAILSPECPIEQYFLNVRAAPAGTGPLAPLRNRESYVVPLEAGQSLVTLAVGAADDCVVLDEEAPVGCTGGTVDCAVGL